MNTFQADGGRTGTKGRMSGGFWSPLMTTLVVIWMTGAMAGAADGPKPVDTPLLGVDGQPLTQAQLAMKFAAHLSPPYNGSDAVGAMAFLTQHIPPVVPLGGWQADKPATLGDLTVLLCRQLRITPATANGQPATELDYQSALVAFGQTVTAQTTTAVATLWQDWLMPTLNPFGALSGQNNGGNIRTPVSP